MRGGAPRRRLITKLCISPASSKHPGKYRRRLPRLPAATAYGAAGTMVRCCGTWPGVPRPWHPVLCAAATGQAMP